MTDNELITQFQNFIDDTPDETLTLQLLNMAKGKLEAELKLEITKAYDTSLTSIVGGTYQTAYSLASIDFFELFDYIYVGTTRRARVPFGARLAYQGDSTKYCIDLKNKNLYLCGTVLQSETITIPYICNTPSITASDATHLTWPERFHMLCPLQAARMWPAIEGGDKGRAWDDRWTIFYNELRNDLINWDAQEKLNAIGGATPYGEDSNYDSPNNLM